MLPGYYLFYSQLMSHVCAAGANMIIADVIASNATPERYRNLVESAVAAHMNMIRVWGGGLYPPQQFYNYCDEMGVLVWQEAMMACALYPRDEAFLQQVRLSAMHPAQAEFASHTNAQLVLLQFSHISRFSSGQMCSSIASVLICASVCESA